MNVTSKVRALLPLQRVNHREIASKDGGLPIEVHPGFIGTGTANELATLIVTAVNAHEMLVNELSAAEQIIMTMLNAMTAEQKRAVHAQLDQASISGEGMTRYHERRAALKLAGAA